MRVAAALMVCAAVAGCGRLASGGARDGRERVAALERWAMRQEAAARPGGAGWRPVMVAYTAHAGPPGGPGTDLGFADEQPRVMPDGRRVHVFVTVNGGGRDAVDTVWADKVESSATGELRRTAFTLAWDPVTGEYITRLAVGGADEDGGELVP